MRRLPTRNFLRPSGFILAAPLLFAAFSAGCGKEAGPASGAPAVKEEARAAQDVAPSAKSTTQAAPPAAAPTDTVADPTKPAEPNKAADPTKADTTRVAQGAKATDPAAPPAAAPPATAEAAPPAATEAAAPPAAAPSTETATPTVVSPKVGESNFSVWMQAGKVKAGQPAVAEVVLVPKNEFHCNENYPFKIKMNDPPAGVTYPSPVVRKEGMSVSPTRGVMRIPFVASTPGEAHLSGKFFFSVCATNQCLMENRDLSITVKVE